MPDPPSDEPTGSARPGFLFQQRPPTAFIHHTRSSRLSASSFGDTLVRGDDIFRRDDVLEPAPVQMCASGCRALQEYLTLLLRKSSSKLVAKAPPKDP